MIEDLENKELSDFEEGKYDALCKILELFEDI